MCISTVVRRWYGSPRGIVAHCHRRTRQTRTVQLFQRTLPRRRSDIVSRRVRRWWHVRAVGILWRKARVRAIERPPGAFVRGGRGAFWVALERHGWCAGLRVTRAAWSSIGLVVGVAKGAGSGCCHLARRAAEGARWRRQTTFGSCRRSSLFARSISAGRQRAQ